MQGVLYAEYIHIYTFYKIGVPKSKSRGSSYILFLVNIERSSIYFQLVMWPVLLAGLRTYAPFVVFPFAVVIGALGYGLESAVSDKHTPWAKSVKDRREERHRSGNAEDDFRVPDTIFDRFKTVDAAGAGSR
jgi:hypothetical protein